MEPAPAGRDGVVLLLMSGILALVLLLSMAFLRLAQASAAGADARSSGALAAVAADSGMEYAGSRLLRDPIPLHAGGAATRGDDWWYREGPYGRLEEAHNPSYAHGEPWADGSTVPDGADNNGDGSVDEAGETDRIWAPGDGAWGDRDGDGARSAWTGRVRNGKGHGLFLLRIESAEGKLPVNAGWLHAQDLSGLGFPTYGPNGDPDHRDLGVLYHRGLSQAIDQLAVAAGLATRRQIIRAGDSSEAADWFDFGWLGRDLISRRPVGGYRGWREVEAALAPLGYPGAEIGRLRAFLTLGPYEGPPDLARASVQDVGRFPAYVPVSLPTAWRETLAAVWMYQTSRQFFNFPGATMPGEPLAWATACRRTGTLPYYRFYFPPPFPAPPPDVVAQILFPDEAWRLADLAACLRQGGALGWRDLYAAIVDARRDLFRSDWLDFTDGDGDGAADDDDGDGVPDLNPVAALSWTGAKADLAFFPVAIDAYPFAGVRDGLTSWASWGIDRDPAAPGSQAGVPGGIPCTYWYRVPRPAAFPAPSPWPGDRFEPYRAKIPSNAGEELMPQGFTLRPAVLFDVASAGRLRDASAGREGVLRRGEAIELSCQEDFESYEGGKGLARRGITAVDDPGPSVRRDLQATAGRSYPRVVSLPRYSRWAFVGTVWPHLNFSRMYGALALASRETGVRGAALYFPFTEDFDTADLDYTTEGPAGPYAYSRKFPTPIFGPDQPSLGPLFNGWADTAMFFFQCPGLDLAPGTPMGPVSLEAWIGPEGRFTVSTAGSDRVGLGARRAQDASATELVLNVTWEGKSSGDVVWTVPDGALGGADRWQHHVVVAAERVLVDADLRDNDADGLADEPGETVTRFRGCVDGSVLADGVPMEYDFPAAMRSTSLELLFVSGLDDLRIYPWALTEADARDRYREERFLRYGRYTSPRYALDAPASLEAIQWTGIRPAGLFAPLPGFADPVDAAPDPSSPLDPFRVWLHAYDGAGTELPGSPLRLGRSGTTDDLRRLVDVRSLRYEVELDCRDAAGVLCEAPLFESIWISFRRPSRAPAWTGWAVR